MSGPRLLIVAALRMEVAPLRRQGWSSLPTLSIHHWPLERWRVDAGEIGAIATGVGGEPCRRALIAVDAHWRPDAVIAVGIAGATDESLHVGDVCLAEVVMETSQRNLSPHEWTLALARDALKGRAKIGKSMTVDEVVPTSEAKRALGQETGCRWVDMESASAARMAHRLALPWLAVRAISDEMDDDLNETLDIIDSHGRIPIGAMIRAALTPRRLRATVTLRRNARLASDNLCQALGALAPHLMSSLV